ncbi:MAG: hypothetical protein ACYCX4_00560 [Bacillota bacterium]
MKVVKVPVRNAPIKGELKLGMNSFIETVNQGMLAVSYNVIYPTGQERELYCFLLLKTSAGESQIRATGVWAKTHGRALIKALVDKFEKLAVKEETYIVGQDRKVLVGFGPAYEAAYWDIKAVDMRVAEAMEEPDLRTSDTDKFYYYSWRKKVIVFFRDGIYQNGGFPCSIKDLNDYYRQIDTAEAPMKYLLDEEGCLWSYKAPCRILTEPPQAVKDKLLVAAGRSYIEKPLFLIGNMDEGQEFLLYNSKIYISLPNKTYLLGNDEACPAFLTGYPSGRFFEGSGLYQKVVLEGVEKIIVPVKRVSVFSKVFQPEDVVVIGNRVHLVAGEYHNIGFVVDRRIGGDDGFNTRITVQQRSRNKYDYYAETVPQLRKAVKEESLDIKVEVEVFDPYFESRDLIEVGDTVEVMEARGSQAVLRGQRGICNRISPNRSIAAVQFPGSYEKHFPMEQLKKVAG